MRYQVQPLDDGQELTGEIIGETDDVEVAKGIARQYGGAYGAGILDTRSSLIDVGFGFGVDYPEEF